MASGDHYRVWATELRARALQEANPTVRAEFESLAAGYLRLAAQAERNEKLDFAYEIPQPKLVGI
jgi:hypothetical protein